MKDKDLASNLDFKAYLRVRLLLFVVLVVAALWWDNGLLSPTSEMFSIFVYLLLLRSCNQIMMLLRERKNVVEEGIAASVVEL